MSRYRVLFSPVRACEWLQNFTCGAQSICSRYLTERREAKDGKAVIRHRHSQVQTHDWSLGKACGRAQPSRKNCVRRQDERKIPTCTHCRCSRNGNTSRHLDQYLWQTKIEWTVIGHMWFARVTWMINCRWTQYGKDCHQVRQIPRISTNYGYCTLSKAKMCHIQPRRTIVPPLDVQTNLLQDRAEAGTWVCGTI